MDASLKKVKEYLDRFDQAIDGVRAGHKVEKLASGIFILHPKCQKSPNVGLVSGKDVALTVSALIHGVEVAGLAVIVELLELVTRGHLQLPFALGIALGNIEAALKSRRFVERDLNRSFGRMQASLAEEKRADELESLFTRTAHLLDIHQVKLQIDRPFWIFPYTVRGYKFARAIAPEVSLITHWGRGFSKDGQCSDEWVNSQGGTGITIELGQNGFEAGQIANGISLCRRAIEVCATLEKSASQQSSALKQAPLYTWGEIIPYPPTGKPVLNPGWHNFKTVRAGEVLGVFNDVEIRAQVSGPVLFPKYPDAYPNGPYGDAPPAAELVRILKEISEEDLPK